MQWFVVGLLLWLAAAGLYLYTSPSAQTVLHIASGKALGYPPVTSGGTVNFTIPERTQVNGDPRVARWAYIELPKEIAKGKSVQLVITFAPRRRKTLEQEAVARIPINFNADEEEPEVQIQILAPNFVVDPSKIMTVKLLKNEEVPVSFRISPSPETPGGKAEIDIQVYYKNKRVGEFTREIKVKDHAVDHLTSRQVTTAIFLMAVLGFIFNYLGGAIQAIAFFLRWVVGGT